MHFLEHSISLRMSLLLQGFRQTSNACQQLNSILALFMCAATNRQYIATGRIWDNETN